MNPLASIAAHLKHTPLFEGSTEQELPELACSTVRRHYHPGEVIYPIDGPADALYFVCEGTIKIVMYQTLDQPSMQQGKVSPLREGSLRAS